MAGGLVATAAAIADAPVRREELRGFQCFHWTAGGLRYSSSATSPKKR
jgi:hypothetical protein